MKITCPHCKGSKHCHIIKQETTKHHSGFGIDEVTKAQIKIHKHHKEDIHCEGSNKVITVCLEDQKYMKGFQR